MDEITKVGYPKMIALGLGFFGTGIFWAFHSASMPLFLSGFTESTFRISLVLSLAGVMGCIVPPVVGYLSDRTVTRFGRRRPYIFFGLLCMGLCILGLPHISIYGLVALVSGLMYLSLVSGEAVYMSLLPDTVPQEQRGTASGIMNMFGSIGLIAYYIVGTAIWDTHRTMVFSIVALVPLSVMFLTLALIKEERTPEEKPAEGGGSPLAYLKGLAEEKNAMIFFIGQAFWWLAIWIFTSFTTLFLVKELGVSEGKSLLASLAFSLVSIIFMLPLGMLGDRLGRKGILTCLLALSVVLYALMGFSRNLTHMLVFAALAGIPFAAVRGVGYAYMLDLIPEERTAEFVGFNYLSQTSSLVFGALIGGILIDSFGYRSMFPAAAIFTAIGLILLQSVRPRGDSGVPDEAK